MAEQILMLALSPTMETGAIAKWHFHEGDAVASGAVLCEVETDKAVMDYEVTTEGVLLKILVPEGSEASVGEAIAIIGKQGEDIRDLVAEASSKPAKTHTEPQEEDTERSAEPPGPSPGKDETSAKPEVSGKKVRSSPLARKLAQEAGLDLHAIKGSGPGGRIVRQDIERTVQEQPAGVSPAAIPQTPGLADEVVRVSQKRKIIAQRLSESKFSAPHYYLKVVVRMDEVLQARSALNARSTSKVSLNAFLLKFAAEAIKKHPMLNSTWNGDTLIKHGSVDIGLAVAQPDGLITPVVRNCGQKGIVEIDQELNVLIQKAQANRLEPAEYSGATFTISSLGSFGIHEFTAIINPPGSAILAVGEIHKEPVVNDQDQIVIHSNLILTLSCDHRVIDGAVGAMFLKDLKEMLEHPIRTLY
ncbi:MAG: dihydrolipoamide acetyltransferase family protein [Candidatus Vecturithrix sp.]|jgi:pyruvate dehydrogenase E2 component (dihydrolipoamide acetyltransferase)|nr:dihydrolipoamide acetyltransferase family protein [Candidatus Vecturithrix sp.]